MIKHNMGINFTIDIYILGISHNNNIRNICSKCLIIKLLANMIVKKTTYSST